MTIFGLKFSVDDAIKVPFLRDPLLKLENELELKLTGETQNPRSNFRELNPLNTEENVLQVKERDESIFLGN